MDARQIAADFGHLLATSTTAHSAVVEAGITKSTIHPYPVTLEPAFQPFDPLQTFEQPGQRHRTNNTPPPATAWVVQEIILPVSDTVDWHHAEAFLAGLAGVNCPLSFELYTNRHQASFYLGAPPTQAGFLAHNWLATYPNSALTQSPDPWTTLRPESLVLCDLYSPAPYHRSMRTHPAVSPWRQLLRLSNVLGNDDTLFAQVIFTPAKQHWHQNIAAIIHAERLLGARAPHGSTSSPKNPAEPIFAAVIRIGSTSSALARSIEAFTGTFSADGQPFQYRAIKDYERTLGMDEITQSLRERTTHTTGQLLTSGELATFVHPPDQAAAESVHLTFLQGLPVPQRLRRHGIPLGTNTDRGEPIMVVQPATQKNKSAWPIGASRKGKSTMLIQRAVHLAKTGNGVGLIDPHGTTATDLLGALEDTDADRVVFLNFDAPTPVAYNPFAHHDEEDYGRLTTEYVNSLKTLFDAERYHRMSHVLGMGIYALFVLNENLATLPNLLAKTPTGEALRRRVIATAKNEAVRHFFQEDYHTFTTEAFAPLTNRLSPLLIDDKTHRTFAQHTNKVDITAAMDHAQILIVRPPASIEAAKIVGGLLIAQAQHAAFRRAGTPRAQQHFHLIIDEFPRFITSAGTLQSIIDETAKGGLSVCLANQETGQIPADLLKAMYSIPNIFVFGVNLPDAKALAHLFNGHVTPETLAGQRTGEVTARIDGDIANFTVPPPLATSTAVAERLIKHSQTRYYATTPTSATAPRRARRVIETITEGNL